MSEKMSRKRFEALDEVIACLKTDQIRQRKVRHNETVPVNRLPVELFCIILEQLDRSELFAYESVCERWSYYVKAFVRPKLAITKRAQVQPLHWFYLDERCPPSSIMVRADLNVELIENSFMCQLKQLKVGNPVVDRVDQKGGMVPLGWDQKDFGLPVVSVELINRLVHLEVLEISKLDCGECKTKPFTIGLRNLKHLAIGELLGSKVLLDCPQLVSFKTKTMMKRDDVYSPSISHLYLGKYLEHSSLRRFTNLQYLNVASFLYMRIEDYPRIFSNFPNLKEISLRLGSSTISYFEHRAACVDCLKAKQASGRDEVVLTFCGIRIDSEDQLENLKYEDCRYESQFLDLLPRLYLRNYSRLCERELKRTKRIGYAGLVEELAKQNIEIPRDFYERFEHLREIQINQRVHDEDRLLVFIGALKRLDSLRFERRPGDVMWERENPPFGNSFFRKLARSCSLRPSFAMGFGRSYRGIIDYDLILEFKSLVYLSTYDDLDNQLVQRLFDHFDTFELSYRHNFNSVEITRSGSCSPFELHLSYSPSKIFSKLDALLWYVDNYRYLQIMI